MKGICLYILFLGLFSLNLSGQSGYIIYDSTMTAGLKLIDNGPILNSRYIQVREKRNIIKYTPYELDEFGFNDGRIFVSRNIQVFDSSRRVFLERLSKGKANLYYYREKRIRTFYIELDTSSIIEIPKIKSDLSFRQQLAYQTVDCPAITDAIRYTRYNKRSMTELVDRYNSCNFKPFPHFRYGIVMGYEFMKLDPVNIHPGDYLFYFNLKYEGSFMVGLFFDQPILVSNVSLHSGIYYSRHGYSYNKLVVDEDLDFVANISSLKLPLLIRYTFNSNKIRPFINAGGLAIMNYRNESAIYSTIIRNNTMEINDADQNFNASRQIGYSLGSGIEYCINSRRSLFIEAGYDKLYGNSGKLKQSRFSFMTGINF